MPVLSTVVTDYLTAIKDSLKLGTDLGSDVRGAAMNYLRAQDMATVLDLLQDAMDQDTPLTVVDGTASSLQDGVQASASLTLTGLAVDTQTVTIGTKVYTWQDALTDVDGNVKIGVSAAACVANLVAAITLTGTPGTDYATSMTVHPLVTAIDDTGDVVTVTAFTSGVSGDLIAIAETGTNMSWGGGDTFLSGGLDAFGPAELDGHVVVFGAATTTVALRGVEARVASNTAASLTFAAPLPAVPVAGDTYTLRGGWFDSHIADLRQGKGLAEAPPGSVYGSQSQVADALITALRRRGTHASQLLTFTGLAIDTQTVTIDGKAYTFQDSLTDVDGNVKIGVSAEICIDNLVAAITLGAGAGTAYATSMTLHSRATAEKVSATVMRARAKLVGTAGDSLATTETLANASWGAATMAGGAAGGSGAVAERNMGHPSLEVGAGSSTSRVVLESLGVAYRIDQFRGMKVVVSGEAPRLVVQSDESSVTVSPPYASAPTATTAVSITIPEDMLGGSVPSVRTHPGAQAGENAMLADMIEQVQAVMASYVLPV